MRHTDLPITSVEKVFTLTFLFVSSGAITELLADLNPPTDSSEGSLGERFLWYGLYFGMVFILKRAHKGAIKSAFRNCWLVLLLALPFLSTAWSADPFLTFKRSVAMLGTTLFAIYFGTRYTLRKQVWFLASTLLAIGILSLLCCLILPQYGVMTGEFQGQWRGVFSHKNYLGRAMALSFVSFLVLFECGCSRRIFVWTGLSLSLLLIMLSTSRTAMLIALFMLVVIVSAKSIRFRTRSVLLFIILAAAALGATIWVLSNYSDAVFQALGRDASLTGRAFIWFLAILSIEQHPLLGFGYSAFWHGAGGLSVQRLAGWAVPHAHNGFLDVILDLGCIGLAVYLIGLAANFRDSLRLLRQGQLGERIWPITCLMFIFAYNFVESSILQAKGLQWVIYVSITVFLYGLRSGADTTNAEARPVKTSRVSPHAEA